MTPTAEQAAIVTAARQDLNLAINAFAGTGKTTTLTLVARAMPRKRILYLAFNKAIATEAQSRMPANVQARTFHSLAFRAMRPDTNRLEKRMHGGFVADHCGLSGARINGAWYYPSQIGRAVLGTISKFCISADRDISIDHVPLPSGMLGNTGNLPASLREMLDKNSPDVEAYRHETAKQAKRLWEMMISPSSSMPITHDTYVKQWALGSPRIDADTILFDEAQDASGLFIDIVERQTHAQRIWVGDSHQQIYEWREAINALTKVKVDKKLHLTESWRFGKNIADIGNTVLASLGETLTLKGHGGNPKGTGKAFLCRTNVGAFGEFVKRMNAQEVVRLQNAEDMIALVDACQDLQNGSPRGPFALFKDWHTLVEHADSPQGRDMHPLVDAVETHGCEALKAMLMKGTREDAPWTISTLHRSKGLEWDEVEIIDDWNSIRNFQDSAEERRLLYVGVTRAILSLKTAPIIEDWLRALGADIKAHDTPPSRVERASA